MNYNKGLAILQGNAKGLRYMGHGDGCESMSVSIHGPNQTNNL